MKLRPSNPFTAVRETGGATFEPALGWWTQAGSREHIALGSAFASHRDALYIPTLQKTGEPVDFGIVQYLKGRARDLGLDRITQAAGIWVLSETGEVQAETVWIAYASNSKASRAVDHEKLAEMATVVKNAANQDAVAWEEDGELKFTDFILSTPQSDDIPPAVAKTPSRLWIAPQADLETVEARELLRSHGECIITTAQSWGARWDALESGVVDAVETYRKDNPVLKVRGIKLEGSVPEGWNAETIHRYIGKGLCPLEAVAKTLSVELGEYKELAALNLKERIAGLREAGVSQGVIDAIRLADRCSQGVTPDEEADAVRAWGKREVVGDLTIVRMPHRCACAPVTDRFEGQYKNILILGNDGESNSYGEAETCLALKEAFPSFPSPRGGTSEVWMRIMENGVESFWGGYPSQSELEAFLRTYFG